ncbi:hypothetical protein Rhopal_007691-T1 [Rhodotorula paludigena]|uniref:Uncharacterized protein n=1 Tax=Rhodotorula paludigena TaxID=86838 RepID=A0AAV5GWL0_9BASI|nr:hypothetical protein Rhopal_007691-T1 [Rhodotorula paludigena]
MMLRFELTRAPSDRHRLLLQPSRVLHPRYHDARGGGKSTGKAMWVACWRDAVELLAKKGSYKRLNSSAFLDPRTVAAKVHSQLARRVVQEADLAAERIKSWPAEAVKELEDAPLQFVTKDEWRERGAELREAVERRGRRLLAVLDLSPVPDEPDSGEAALSTPSPLPFSIRLSDPPRPPITHYHLARFFADVSLPPASLPPSLEPTPPDAYLSSAEQLLHCVRHPLEQATERLARRFGRREQGKDVEGGGADLMLVSAQALEFAEDLDTAENTLRCRMTQDVVPLVVALERCRLWVGEGWVDVRKTA